MSGDLGQAHDSIETPRCFVVGMGSLAAACMRALLDGGYQILGVHSPDGSLVDCAAELRLEYFTTSASFEASLATRSFEWLFSINNPWIIPPAVLALPKLMTINYHDSPLPRYRGLHATSWALIHGEQTHAISFHEVTDGIDTGRMLSQTAIPITPDDSAWSLNAKCFETAIGTFQELTARLCSVQSRDSIAAVQQDGNCQSYFGKWQRPHQAAIINFASSAESIRNLVRGLDLGPVENPLGTPKLYDGDALYVVGQAEILAEVVPDSIGRIVRYTSQSIDVATATSVVRLSRLCTLQGETVDASLLVGAVARNFASVLPRLTEGQSAAITCKNQEVCRHEDYFRRMLAGFCPPDLGLVTRRPVAVGTRCPLPLLSTALADTDSDRLLARVTVCISVFLSKSNTVEPFDLGIVTALPDLLDASLFASVVPLRVQPQLDQPLHEFASMVGEQVERTRAKGTYATDIRLRYPELRARAPIQYSLAVGTSNDAPSPESVRLYVGVAEEQRQLWLTHHGALDDWQVAVIDDALACIASEVNRGATAPVGKIPWMTEATKRRVLLDWNGPDLEIPDAPMHVLFDRRVHQQPNALAVRAAGVSLSYQELYERSCNLAQQMIVRGVRPGDLVAISLARSCEVIVAMLATLRLGAAYLPIDPAYPAERGRTMVESAKVTAAITESNLRDKYFAKLEQVLAIDEPAAPLTLTQPLPDVDPLGLFCVIYTSGSTGKPKGVEVTHRGMVNHATAIVRNYELAAGDRVLCSASIGFDVCGEQIYPALIGGAAVVMRPEDLFDSFQRFEEFVRGEGITVMVLPTSFWHEWTRELAATDSHPPNSLRALSVGTEKALGDSLAQWQALTGGRVRFYQGYGPTETTITSTMYLHDDSSIDDELPIGRPLPNTQVYLLDAALQPVPIGMVGELYIAGAGVARGYRNEPGLTAERFVDCPFRPSVKMYRTGDIARYRPDGQLVFVGRRDSQVKVRGYRVELAEIEHALRQHPDVTDAVVLLRSDQAEPRLVAYVIQQTSETQEGLLVDFLAARLPHYMVPQTIVVMDRFPMTANQKIDKRALPAPQATAEANDQAREASASPLQESLVRIWAELLGKRPRIEDDFFAIGGHSLLAVRMLSMVQRQHDTLIPLSRFVQNPTIAGLGAQLSTVESAASPMVTIQPGTSRPPLWLVHPVGGHVVYGYQLRRYMSPDQPITGLQAQGVEGQLSPLEDIAEMAHEYVNRICQVQTKGPYFVAGPSMGGLIAMEMAQQLRRRGKHVALLALIDTWGPGYPRPTSRLRKVIDQVNTVRTLENWEQRFALLRARLCDRFDSTRDGRDRTIPRYAVPGTEHMSAELLSTIREVWEANERANSKYEAAPYAGAVLLLRAKQTPRWSGMRFEDPYNGWRALMTGPFECRTIDVSHTELADNPPELAAKYLQEAIDAAWNACAGKPPFPLSPWSS